MHVKISANGPIMIDTKGQISVSIEGSKEEKAGPVFLCRCGQSASKPFCDGTHRKAQFAGPAAELEIMTPS